MAAESLSLPVLRRLEAESIHILREVASEFERPVLMYSVGKDSSVLLRLAQKAFHPGRIPFPLLHVDTAYKFPEMYAFRDRVCAEVGVELRVLRNEPALAADTNPWDLGTVKCCGLLKTQGLLDALRAGNYDAVIGGARREEERSRAKERIYSFRDRHGQWDPKNQRPELWDLYNARAFKGENIRVFPISNWTEFDVWQYIERENLELPSIYYAHTRPVVRKAGGLLPVTDLTPAKPDDKVEYLKVRFRTVGDITCTAPVESHADTVAKIIAETAETTITERGATRLDDQTSEASMEQRKKEGYF